MTVAELDKDAREPVTSIPPAPPHWVLPEGAVSRRDMDAAGARVKAASDATASTFKANERRHRNVMRLVALGVVLVLLEIAGFCTDIILKQDGAHTQTIALIQSRNSEVAKLTSIASSQAATSKRLASELKVDRNLLNIVDAVASPSQLARDQIEASAAQTRDLLCTGVHNNQNIESAHGWPIEATPPGCPHVPIVKPPSDPRPERHS